MKKTILMPLLLCSGSSISIYANIEVVHVAPPAAQQHYFLVMKGAYEQSSGNYAEAAETFAALTPFIESPQIRVAAWQVAFDQKKYHTLTNAADEIRSQHASNEELQLKLAQSFLHTNQLNSTIELLRTLRTEFPHDHRIAYFAVLALLKQDRVAEANNIIDAVLRQESLAANHYLFHFLRAKNAFLTGNYNEALQHINYCPQTHASFSRVQVLEGLTHEKMGNKKKALACYTLYLKQSPHDEDIRQKQVMLAFECGDFLLVQNVLQKNPKDDATYYHDLALVTFKLGDYKKAHDLLNKAESLSPRFSKARTLRIHLLTAQQKYDEIAQLFTTWLTESPGDAGLIKTIMKLEAKGLSRTSVHNILRSAAQEKATLPVCFALADMLHEAGEYDEARTWYDTALSVDPQEGEKKGLTSSQLHFQKACTHFRENNHQAMYNELAAAQQSSIVYPSVYNLLSFADPAAPDALALVNKALEADASNEAYLATKKSVVLTKGQ